METGIYQEVQQMIEDEKYLKKRADNRLTKHYHKGRVDVLIEVLTTMEAFGLRYDEHGASGRRDGEDSQEQQAEDAGEGFVKKDKWNKKLNKLLANDQDGSRLSKLARMERSIVMLELRVNALNEVIHKHNLL